MDLIQYRPINIDEDEIRYMCFESHVIFFNTLPDCKFNSLPICELNKYDICKKNIFEYTYDDKVYNITLNITYGLHTLSKILIGWVDNQLFFLNHIPLEYFLTTEEGEVFSDIKNIKYNEKIKKCITLYVIQHGKLWTETFYPHPTPITSYHFLKRCIK